MMGDMNNDPQPAVSSCSFYVRTPTDGGYFYDQVYLSSPHNGRLYTAHPPHVGDLIHLWDTVKQAGGTHRVIARQWLHSSYGSTNWPRGEAASRVGPMLDVIVEPAEGVFRDQVSRSDEDEGLT